MTEEKKEEKKEEAASKEQKPEVSAEKKEAKERKPEAKLSQKSKGIVDTLEGMTVLELSDLVKTLEDKFGVSAQAPVTMVGQAMPGAAAGAEEEKSAFTVILKETGPNKIQVIKEIRSVTSLGLKEAKDLVEAAPKPVKEGATKEEAEKIKAQLEKVGAKVELK